MPTTQKTPRSEPQRRETRRSKPPPSGGAAPRPDGDRAGVERVHPSSDSLQIRHAVALRNELKRIAAEYDLEEHLGRTGRPSAWMEGTAAACALCADPGPVLAAMLSVLNNVTEGADSAGVNHE